MSKYLRKAHLLGITARCRRPDSWGPAKGVAQDPKSLCQANLGKP